MSYSSCETTNKQTNYNENINQKPKLIKKGCIQISSNNNIRNTRNTKETK